MRKKNSSNKVFKPDQFPEVEKKFLKEVTLGFVHLHNLIRLVFYYRRLKPTYEEFLTGMDFLAYLIEKYPKRLKCEKDFGAKKIKATPNLINWIKKMWNEGKYEDINYSVWFDLREEGKEEEEEMELETNESI